MENVKSSAPHNTPLGGNPVSTSGCEHVLQKCVVSNRLECLVEILSQRLVQSHQQQVRPLIAVPSEACYSYVVRALSALLPEGGMLGVEIVSLDQALDKVVHPLVSSLQVTAALLQAKIPLTQTGRVVHSFQACQENSIGTVPTLEQQVQDVVSRLSLQEAVVSIRDEAKMYELFLFGFSSLLPRYLKILSQLTHSLSIEGFFLAPCMMYWTDLINDRAVNIFIEKYLAKQANPTEEERYRALLLDRNPLLANCARVGKEFLQHLETCQIETRYALSQPVQRMYDVESLCEQFDVVALEGSATLLEQLQGSLLLLAAEGQVRHVAKDDSVQVHGAPTRLREVEVLYEQLSKMTFNAPLTPGAICIAVERLDEYLPAIERVFKAPTSCFSYTVLEKRFGQYPEIEAVEAILNLPAQRFSKEALLHLISLRVVQENCTIDGETWARFVPQFKNLPFSFGFDAAHRAALLQAEGFSVLEQQEGSWKDAEEALRVLYTSGKMSGNESACMNNVVHVISRLFADVGQIVQTVEPLSFWLSWFYQLLETYVKTEEEGYAQLLSAVEQVKQCAPANELFSFSQFTQLIRAAYRGDPSCFMRHATHEVVVTEWTSIGMPCQVLAVLGLQEKPVASWSVDAQRYQIIDAVLAARRCLYLSYTNYSYEDGASKALAFQVKELLRLCSEPARIQTQHSLISESLAFRKSTEEQQAPILPHIEPKQAYYVSLEEVRTISQKPLMAYFRTALGLELATQNICSRDKNRYGWFEPEGAAPRNTSAILPQATTLAQETYKRQRLHRDGISSNPCRVELSVSCMHAYEAEAGYWVLPAIHCNSRLLYGMLQESTDEGFVVQQSYSKDAIYEMLPDLLVRGVINLRGDCDLPNLIYFAKEGKTVRVSIPNPLQSLEHYLDIMEQCRGRPMPLYPESVVALAQGKPVQGIQDPYFTYAQIEEVDPAWVDAAKKLIESVEVHHV